MKLFVLRRDPAGFTLIELMIVVAIIALLSAILVPKMSNLIVKSRESNLKGSLSSMRSALQIYYSSAEGVFPADLSSLTFNGTYLASVPSGTVPAVSAQGNPGHDAASGVLVGDGTGPTDVAGGNVWYYVNTGPLVGSVFVNCIHLDTSGNVWTQN